MDSMISPREIQSRIRAGESLDDVALAAGIPRERVEPYAAPVLAEREHVAALAQTQPVRRLGETAVHRTLRSVISDRLLTQGIDFDSLSWDSWRQEDRKWIVEVTYRTGKDGRRALFLYDPSGRFSVAHNDDARWLIDESSVAHPPPPGRRRPGEDPDTEPTVDLYDELALVRAVQPDIIPELPSETEDAFTEGELAEVDGVYDIVPAEASNLDVLYDMLASFDEDSVQIYQGLITPADVPDTTAPVLDAPPSPVKPPPPAPEPVVAPPFASEAEQHSLLGEEEDAGTAQPKQPRKKRASVPTWDEIMFGTPRPK